MVNLSDINNYRKAIELMEQHLQREHILSLKKLSNDIIEYAVVKNDLKTIYLAVISYVLYKILAQTHIVKAKSWKTHKQTILNFLDKIEYQDKNNLNNAYSQFKILFRGIDSELANYIENISYKGKTKVGVRLYEMGFSYNKIIELLHVNIVDLQNYASSSRPHKESEELINSKKKILLNEQNMNLIFDSSALISLGNNGLDYLFEEFKKRNPKINLYLMQSVYDETIAIKDKVIRFGWLSVKYEKLIKNKVFEVVLPKKTELITNLENTCNSIYFTKHGKLEILQAGELESVAYTKEKNAILVIDEITTRWLLENPYKLHSLMENRYKEKVSVDKKALERASLEFKNIKVVRSIDLIAFFIERGYFDDFKDLDYKRSLMYAVKNGGCSTTYEEIDSYLGESK